jgi:hypothetical protein
VAALTIQKLAEDHEEQTPEPFGVVRILDGSVITLSKWSPWAEYSRLEKAIRLHVCLTRGTGMTLPPIITTGKVPEQFGAAQFVIEPGVTYLFDRGYIDHRAFNRYCEQGIFFVTRLMPHNVYKVLESRPTTSETIVADEIIELGCKIRRVKHPLRVVVVQPPGSEPVKFLTNRFDLTAEQVERLYRQRWKIELFFRWVKQNLRLKHFIGRSEAAVHAQVYAAFITHALLVSMQQATETSKDMLATLRRIRYSLWSKVESAPQAGCRFNVARFNGFNAL